MNTSSAYCDFVYTNQTFNNKPVYQCEYCGLKLGLEDPNTKILCFKKMREFHVSIEKLNGSDYANEIMDIKPGDAMQNLILEKAVKKYSKEKEEQNDSHDDPANLCSQEEIQQRLNICQQCEHYKDNSCLLCGCVIVREANYMNKLAHKNQKCPIDKWSEIKN